MKLLLVEDSSRLRETLEKSLRRLGHAVDSAADGGAGYSMGLTGHYDAVILDRMLPDRDGFQVLEQWRRAGIETPVLMLTALGEVEDKVRGLGLGADDYLTKPFALAELVARLEAVVRRKYARADSRVKVGPLEIDFAAKSVRRDGEAILLTAREFSVLECLAKRPGRVLSRAQIEEQIYNDLDSPLSNAVDAAIYSLRKKLCPANTEQLIHTRRGLGYVFEA